MALGPEAKVIKWLCSNRSQRKGKLFEIFPDIFVYNVHGGVYGTSGIPDFLLCWRGQLIGLEVKASRSNKPSEMQNLRLFEIKQAGGIAAVLYGKDEEKLKLIKSIIEKRLS